MSADASVMNSNSLGRPGWYQRFFAWMMAKGMGRYQQAVAHHKRNLFTDLRGDVLEIGPGTGANLVYFPPDIRWIGIEPNPFMHAYLKDEAQRVGLNIDVRLGTAERMEADDRSVDAVISTLVLCSVPDVSVVLRDIMRVLRPGGQFVFMEHVAAPQGTSLRRVQRAIRPVWQWVGDGCQPDRELWVELGRAGFERVECRHFQVPFPIIRPHIMGVATKGVRE
jgi:ubiquinone/menaquinone biosynthesis C-methylase UbiE